MYANSADWRDTRFSNEREESHSGGDSVRGSNCALTGAPAAEPPDVHAPDTADQRSPRAGARLRSALVQRGRQQGGASLGGLTVRRGGSITKLRSVQPSSAKGYSNANLPRAG